MNSRYSILAIVIVGGAMLSACGGGNEKVVEKREIIYREKVVEKPQYRLYSTGDKNVLLNLNTANGDIDIVQLVDNDKSGFERQWSLKTFGRPVVEDQICGRFEIYPTDDNFHYIMLDKVEGDVFHVRWSYDKIRYTKVRHVEIYDSIRFDDFLN